MSVSFSFSRELSDDDLEAIDGALKRHAIELSNDRFERLCNEVEQALRWYWFNHDKRAASRADTLNEIAKLQAALGALSETALFVLEAAAQHAQTCKRFDATSKTSDLWNALYEQWSSGKGIDFELTGEHNDNPMPSLYQFAVLIMKESCEIALSEMPPIASSGDNDIVTAVVAKGGRPRDITRQLLVGDLAAHFRTATGHAATDTEYGAFDDFLSVCLRIIDPEHADGTNRKLIRAALYEGPGRVPKPRQTS